MAAKGSFCDSIPIIDFSQLMSSNPDQRSKVLQELDKACEEWGFFELINHEIPEALMKSVIDTTLGFFKLPEEEKKFYEAKHALDPVIYGSSIVGGSNSPNGMNIWRDFLKLRVHPKFHCPQKPQNLSDIILDYTGRVRFVLRKLLEGISNNLGLEDGHMDEVLDLDSCYQIYAANHYPPCPNPDQAIGLPVHTDYGLLTLLIHNGIDGLQLLHNEEWVNPETRSDSILVNVGDHLEIFSNGKYKTLKHRALVNNESTRISIVLAHGAAPEATVSPAAQLVERDGRALYRPMKFIDYVETAVTKRISVLETLKIV